MRYRPFSGGVDVGHHGKEAGAAVSADAAKLRAASKRNEAMGAWNSCFSRARGEWVRWVRRWLRSVLMAKGFWVPLASGEVLRAVAGRGLGRLSKIEAGRRSRGFRAGHRRSATVGAGDHLLQANGVPRTGPSQCDGRAGLAAGSARGGSPDLGIARVSSGYRSEHL
jgi:hypothetical protein